MDSFSLSFRKLKRFCITGEPAIIVYYNHDFSSNDGILNDGTKDITANNRECNDLCAKTSGEMTIFILE